MDDEEKSSLCERILLDLDNIFKRDSNILEFDIIESSIESTCNKSPVIFIDHHIALEKWCVPHLYEYAYRKLLNFKINNNRTEFHLLHQWSRIILLLNPDFTTAWNLRRDLVIKSVNSYLDEIRFSELVLIRKPKCASAFSFREWLLNFSKQQRQEIDEDLLLNELKITLEAADRYSRNYYAWSHRTWILTIYIENCPKEYILNKIITDLKETELWLQRHISDYSCFQHRQFLFNFIHRKFKIDSLSNECQTILLECKELFMDEFKLLNNLWKLYPDQESLYLHRRFLLRTSMWWRNENEIDLIKEQEKKFYQEVLCNLLKSSSSCNNKIWLTEMIQRRYLSYLKRNLDWKFD